MVIERRAARRSAHSRSYVSPLHSSSMRWQCSSGEPTSTSTLRRNCGSSKVGAQPRSTPRARTCVIGVPRVASSRPIARNSTATSPTSTSPMIAATEGVRGAPTRASLDRRLDARRRVLERLARRPQMVLVAEAEPEAVALPARYDVHVHVEDVLESRAAVGEEEVHALAAHAARLERGGDLPRDAHHVRGALLAHVREPGAVLRRDHQHVPGVDRLDVQERDASVVAVDDAGRLGTLQDLAEDAGALALGHGVLPGGGRVVAAGGYPGRRTMSSKGGVDLSPSPFAPARARPAAPRATRGAL